MTIITLSLIASIYKLPFSYGVSFSFGSLFVIIILRYYGILIASFLSIAINILDLCFFNANVYVIFFVFEIMFLGMFWRNKKRNLFLMDALYWIFIGAPASALVFSISTKSLGIESYLIITNNCINSFINVLIADLAITYLPIQRLFGYKEKKLTDLNKLMSHLTMAAVLGPFLVYTLIDGWLVRERVNSEIYQVLNKSGSSIMDQLESWNDNDLRKVRLKSPKHLMMFKNIIKNNPFSEKIRVLVMDKENNIYLTDNESTIPKGVNNWKDNGDTISISENIYQWMPEKKGFNFDIKQWRQSFYMKTFSFHNVDLQMQIRVPLTDYTDSMWRNYLNKFLVLISFCFISIFISIMMSRFLSRDLSKLTKSTTGLPDKLKRREMIEWPETSITQVNNLACNFQVMSEKLLAQTKELENSREEMERLAYNDALTGLPNRFSFTNYLEELLANSNGENIAVMFIDLNRFKQINDTLGHEIGDILLKEVAQRLRYFLKEDSFVARQGGDEFVVILRDADEEKASIAAGYINKALGETININVNGRINELYVSGSIGISLYPQDAQEKSTLLKYADLAMYAAKETGENTYKFYFEVAESNMSEKLFLEQSLCKALERNEFIVNYQPKFDLKQGVLSGMEALIRWNHPQRGLIMPNQFISLAEETGIINQIGEWVLIESCKQNKQWQDKGYPPMCVSVNLSIRQFYGNNIVKTVRKALDISGLKPEYLELEITEGFFVKNSDFIISVLKELSSLGVYISIDDFGSGYSSLGRLKELPVNIVKIDKIFVDDVATESNNTEILSSIIQLAHSIGLKVIAEGVETIKELEILKAMDCDEVQGYLISRPLSNVDMEKLIKNFSLNNYALM